mmetsp:Transcript_17687/g.31812  ORF Transcript_17687/g.31812 Transcript_17687/m.31812 type:complete len:341 (+) Transcript_17687:8997-10019(+)
MSTEVMTSELDQKFCQLRQEGVSDLLIETLNSLKLLALQRYDIAKPQAIREHIDILKTELDEIEESFRKYEVQTQLTQQLSQTENLEGELPERVYSYSESSKNLYWTGLRTGETNNVALPAWNFHLCCTWCEVPQHYLYFTGGLAMTKSNDVVCISVKRDFSLTQAPYMLVPRYHHNSAYFRGFIYVIGGFNGYEAIHDCEKYSLVEEEWGSLPPLPTAVYEHSLIVHSQALYVLGGCGEAFIQELSLDVHVWKVLGVKLPVAFSYSSCFKLGEGPSALFIMQGTELFKFDSKHHLISRVSDLQRLIFSQYGPCYYSQGLIYASNSEGAPRSLEVSIENS